MDITTQTRDTDVVVAIAGELDVHTAPDLEAALQAQIEQGNTNLVVDLTAVEFLDSTGLGVMVKALKWAREGEGGLRVVAPHERIAKVFTITGLAETMQLSDSVD